MGKNVELPGLGFRQGKPAIRAGMNQFWDAGNLVPAELGNGMPRKSPVCIQR
jgi:hypothetical protein